MAHSGHHVEVDLLPQGLQTPCCLHCIVQHRVQFTALTWGRGGEGGREGRGGEGRGERDDLDTGRRCTHWNMNNSGKIYITREASIQVPASLHEH